MRVELDYFLLLFFCLCCERHKFWCEIEVDLLDAWKVFEVIIVIDSAWVLVHDEIEFFILLEKKTRLDYR
jgi:hypothetical protein